MATEFDFDSNKATLLSDAAGPTMTVEIREDGALVFTDLLSSMEWGLYRENADAFACWLRTRLDATSA